MSRFCVYYLSGQPVRIDNLRNVSSGALPVDFAVSHQRQLLRLRQRQDALAIHQLDDDNQEATDGTYDCKFQKDQSF